MAVHSIPVGKLPVDLLDELLDAGALPPEVLVGPAVGEDAAAIAVAEGVLVAATDPITLVGRGIGRFAVVINANDVAVTGARPRWFLAAVLLPPGVDEAVVRETFTEIRDALASVGAALVGGHTEVTPAVSQPVVVGHMLGVTTRDELVTTSGAEPGDVLVQVGPAPVEGTAILATDLGDRLTALDPEVLAAARAAIDDPGIAIVGPALRAADLGATSMHDVTEGGIAGGLHEVARAAGVAVTVDRGSIRWFGPGRAVCSELGVDPWATLASGCLLATFPSAQADAAVEQLGRDGHQAARIGRIRTGVGVADADGVRVPCPERDELARLLDG